MPIAVFDIDGTLTDTTDVDVECYEAAIRSELGVEIPRDWETLDEITDSAILAAACELQGHPIPDQQTEGRIASLVGQLLEAALSLCAERFQPIDGAREVFHLLREAGWDVAMATGAWRPSALVKLDGAGIPHRGVPLASSSEHRTRRDIIQRAVASVAPKTPTPVVYFGDGVWDGRSATALGYGFLGVGRGAEVTALMEAGAMGVIPDFSDTDLVLEKLDHLRG